MVDIRLIPRTECLKDSVARVLPYWYDTIVPEIKVGIVTLLGSVPILISRQDPLYFVLLNRFTFEDFEAFLMQT